MTEEQDKYAQRLIEAGMPSEQAYAIASKKAEQEPWLDKSSKPKAAVVDKYKPKSAFDHLPDLPTPPQVSSVPVPVKETKIDYRQGNIPVWVKDLIDTHLAIEQDDAKKAGALGFMARSLILATLPYRDQKNADGTPKESFTRKNGDFRLRIVAGYTGGIPFGIYPRLLMSWVNTEAVRKQSPVIELGDSLRIFLRDVLDLRSTSGGKRGTGTLVTEQMKRLFGSLVTAQFESKQAARGFSMSNIMIAERLELGDSMDALWEPQEHNEAGHWQSRVRLTNSFFQECIENPVPIDLRAYKALRGSAMAMDIYTWLTFRMSYLKDRSKPIRWEALMLQFGSGIGAFAEGEEATKRAVFNFRRDFLKNLQLVQIVYPDARIDTTDTGLILLPSRPHVLAHQARLF